jgi:antitoxin ParD1/3/4
MTTLTISLPDSLKSFIDAEVAAKGYGNVSEYIRGLLRDAQTKAREAQLEAMLIEGLASQRLVLDDAYRAGLSAKVEALLDRTAT